MPKPLENKADIEFLVNTFYQKVINDEVIGDFFTNVVKLDFDHHLPIMYRFWESILLNQATYKGKPIDKHISLNKQKTLQPHHFEQWLQLWQTTIDEHFTGELAEKAKQRAQMLAQLMQYKIEQSNNKTFIH